MRAAAWLVLACAGCGASSVDPSVDLACGDLTHPSADLACAGPPTVEDCFDGVDNDCNGLADCADPACGEIAECVPAAPGFQLGAAVDGDSDCPAHFGAGETLLRQGLAVPPGCTGCTCAPSLVCSTTLEELSITPNDCAGTPQRSWKVDSATCLPADPLQPLDIQTGSVRVGAMQAEPGCAPAGTPSPTALAWGRQARFCATPRTGSGCALGWACVARAAHHCALAPGAAACTANYAAEGGGSWYAGVDDRRDCGAACACGAPDGGSCGQSVLRLYASSLCLGTQNVAGAPGNACALDAPLNGAQVVLQAATLPACAAVNAARGGVQPTDEQTLCCL